MKWLKTIYFVEIIFLRFANNWDYGDVHDSFNLSQGSKYSLLAQTNIMYMYNLFVLLIWVLFLKNWSYPSSWSYPFRGSRYWEMPGMLCQCQSRVICLFVCLFVFFLTVLIYPHCFSFQSRIICLFVFFLTVLICPHCFSFQFASQLQILWLTSFKG